MDDESNQIANLTQINNKQNIKTINEDEEVNSTKGEIEKENSEVENKLN